MNSKDVVDLLHAEYARVSAKAAATDTALFNYISIGGVPLLVFAAYVLSKSEYQIFFAALPVLSILSSFVVVLLGAHYSYTGAYSNYLENRLNNYIGTDELRDSAFSRCAYRAWSSPVRIFSVVGAIVLVAGNLIAVPAINIALARYLSAHVAIQNAYPCAVQLYWLTVSIMGAGALGLVVVSTRLVTRSLNRTLMDALASHDKVASTEHEREPAA
jgi:hypothetical protein